MAEQETSRIIEKPELRDRLGVFRDRSHAGEELTEMLSGYRGSDGIVMAIPAGGVPVAAAIARGLGISLDVAVVSKITPPWNTEVGYGAVAFDGSVQLNDPLARAFLLTEEMIQEGIEKTREKVERRLRQLRGDRPMPEISRRTVILVDDGLASGFTMRVAVAALRKAAPERVLVAVPTGHLRSVEILAREADTVYCANVRAGRRFSVADAYQEWSDVEESTLAQWLTP